MAKKTIWLLCSIFVIFGGLFGAKFWQIDKAMSSRKPPPPPTVTVINVEQEKWHKTIPTIGSLNPELGIILSNEIAGVISGLHVGSGQWVQKGELIVELDSSTDVATLNGLVATERLAKIKFSRLAKLLKRNATSTSSHDEALAQLDIAKAAVIAQKSIIAKKKIRAPFSGKMGIRLVSLGQYLDKGTQIAPLVSLSSTIADFTLPERHFAKLKEEQTVLVKVQAYPNEVFKGAIQAINPGMHEETRTVAVRAIIENPEEKLRAGMFAEIEIIVSEPEPVLTIPETAILYNTYGKNVYIVHKKDNQHIATQNPIQTGEHKNGHVEITSGLTLNDTIVNEGHVKLRNKMAVTIANNQ